RVGAHAPARLGADEAEAVPGDLVDADALPALPGALPPDGAVDGPLESGERRGGERATVLEEGDRYGEEGESAGEVPGAVDRVDDPGEGGRGAGEAALLAVEAVVGEPPSQGGEDALLDGEVGVGDRVVGGGFPAGGDGAKSGEKGLPLAGCKTGR